MNKSYDWVSLGGGAAGFFGAIRYAELISSPCKILILEAGESVLSKVRISGGGRCNVTHHCFDIGKLCSFYPRGHKELKSVFSRFQPRDLIEWFGSHGVSLKTEEDGRMFPRSDSSSTIIELFLHLTEKYRIELQKGQSVKELKRSPEGYWEIETSHGMSYQAKNILVASGSSRSMWSILERLGLTIVPPVPSLFSFNITDTRFEGLSGRSFNRVRIHCKESPKLRAEGALLITHWGLSGPAVLKLSAWGARWFAEKNYEISLVIDFLPEMNEEELRLHVDLFSRKNSKKTLKNSKPVSMPSDYWLRLLEFCGCSGKTIWADVSRSQIHRMLNEFKRAEFKVLGKTTNKEEFVTAGGVDCKEIDFKTMQSKKFPGLYFAGEVLNIDGVTGGFNFQNAWSTAELAARACAQ